MIKYKLSLILKTVINLKPIQIYYRIYYWFASKLKRFRLNSLENRTSDVLSAVFDLKKTTAPFLKYQQWESKDINQLSFMFLNEKVVFKNRIDWQAPEQGRLWRYNLHYFQYLLIDDIDKNHSISLITDWIKANPPGTLDAWDPFPISLRIVSWIKFLSFHAISEKTVEPVLTSIKQQALWLEKNLEFHLLGNHLFKNGKALLFMGLYFKGKTSERWLSKGLKILNSEIEEQILPDGGHFERSPMYHSMILEDCLDILNVADMEQDARITALCSKLKFVVERMVHYLGWMSHPDGQISLFNDAAFGIESAPEKLFSYYSAVTRNGYPLINGRFCAFADSGYFILSPSKQDKMIIDCGDLGPEYQPGHSHCDTLSFELSLNGERVIVDSGCYQYEDSSIRKYNRGNAGHNTITIDDKNQSEVWSAHRCAHKAKPLGGECGELDDKTLWFKGGHDGYKRLNGSPLHYREINWKGCVCIVKDTIKGNGKHLIKSRLHINPMFGVEKKDEKAFLTKSNSILLTIGLLNKCSKVEITKGWYCPEFGKKKECVVLEYSAHARLPFECGWILETKNLNGEI